MVSVSRTRSVTNDAVTEDVVNRGIDILEGLLPLEAPAFLRARSTVTGVQNNYAVDALVSAPNVYCGYLEWNGASGAAFTGIAGGIDGRVLLIRNLTATWFSLVHQHAGSTAANRLRCPGGSATVTGGTQVVVGAGGGAILIYDGTDSRWDVLPLGDEAWVEVAYSSGNFFGSGQTWTVGSGAQKQFSYRYAGMALDGRFYFDININLLGTSISGGPAPVNIVLLPFNAFETTRYLFGGVDNSSGFLGWGQIVSGTNQLLFYGPGLGNWQNAAGTTDVTLQLRLKV